jgi:hypothetical protein
VASEQYAVLVNGLDALCGPKRKIVFHGVNKSGSLALSEVLRQAYLDERRGNQFFSHYRGIPRDFEHLLQLIESPSGHSFFVGHSLYGAYESRPDEHLLVTQFRNPLPRVLSCYQWLKNKGSKRCAATAAGRAVERFRGARTRRSPDPFPSLEEWVLGTRGVVHSQVAQFAFGFRPGWQKKRATATPEQLFELSLANIARDVHWFGIAEHFEESIFCLSSLCGLPFVRPWRQDNRNKGRALTHEWPERDLEVVRQVFHWDFQLYDHMLQTFRGRVDGLTIGGDLELYRDACRDQYKERLDVDGTPLQPLPRPDRRRISWSRK